MFPLSSPPLFALRASFRVAPLLSERLEQARLACVAGRRLVGARSKCLAAKRAAQPRESGETKARLLGECTAVEENNVLIHSTRN